MQTRERSLKILLVEDNIIAVKVNKVMLEQIGCIVDVAEDGRKALAMGQEEYDLIFMDLGLPYLSGVEVTVQLRQLEKTTNSKKIPIVGLTAYDLKEVEKECLSAGMDAVINKPATAEILRGTLDTYLSL
jgi:CheY-like chemotaxis protein